MDRTSAELEMALAESVHRARNDLQAVISMLRLQAIATTDRAVRAALKETEIRVLALSSLNNRLDATGQGATGFIDSVAFLDGLAADLEPMHFDQRPVTLTIAADSHPIAMLQGKPLGLILNELVVNALKYAFPDDAAGEVRIAFRRLGADYELVVADDGIGIDPNAPARGTGLGKRLVRALVMQIDGRFAIRPGATGGAECVVTWPAGAGDP